LAQDGDQPQGEAQAKPRRIWDVPVRIFHWLLVLSIAASWATAEVVGDEYIGGVSWMQVHMWLGYWTAGLIAFRIIWGIIGSRHARFWSFLKGPMTTVRYGASLFGGHREAPGHNPMGAWMVIAMLALVGWQVATGLFANDDIVWSGPWAHTVSDDFQSRFTNWHRFNFNLILAAIGVHVLAIATYQFGLRKDLVGPMFTGRKAADRVAVSDAISGTPWLRAVLAIVLAGAFAYGVVALAPEPPPSEYEDYGY